MGNVIRLSDHIQTKDFKNELGEIGVKLDGLSQKFIGVIESIKKSNEALKNNGTAQSQTNKAIKTTNNNLKQMTALEKERVTVQKQTQQTLAKLLVSNEQRNKSLQKGKILLQSNNKVLKDKIKIQNLASGKMKEEIRTTEQLKLARQKATEAVRKELGVAKKRNNSFKRTLKNLAAMGAAYIGIRQAIRLFSTSITTIKDFSKAMDEVAAITKSTGPEFKLLKNNAKELGATTSKTASQVAGLQKEYAKLGFSTKEILAATEATISLSIAAGSDLAESAVVAASTIRGFGLEASESQRVVDVMAESFTSSALDMQKFSTAMASVAPVASAVNVSLEETTGWLSVVVDAGIDASTAGTSLRNIFLKLKEEGLTLNEALDQINNSSDSASTAFQLFGKRGVATALVMANNRDKAEELTKAYEGSAGAAAEMARVMEDNLQGDVNKLSSAWEGLVLTFDRSESGLRKIVQGFTKMLGAITKIRKVKISDEIKEEQLQLNILVGRLTASNTKEDDRRKLIEEIRKINPDVVEGINAENVAIDLLTKNLAKANLQYLNKIALQLEEEKLQETRDKAGKRLRKEIKAENRLREEISRALLKYNVATEIQTKSFQEQIDALKQTDAALVSFNSSGQKQASTVQNLEQSLRELNARQKEFKKSEDESILALEKRNALAKRLGILTSEEITSLELKNQAELESAELLKAKNEKEVPTLEQIISDKIALYELEASERINIAKEARIAGGEESVLADELVQIEIDKLNKILAINELTVKQKADFNSQYLDIRLQQINEEEAAEIAALEAKKTRGAEEMAELQDWQSRQVVVKKEALLAGIISEEEFAEEMIQLQIDTLNEQLEITSLNNEEKLALEEELVDAQIALDDMRKDNALKNEDEIAKKRADTAKLIGQIATEVSNLATNLYDRELAYAEKKKDQEIKLVGENADHKQRIEEDFAKKKADILRKQANAEKTAAIISAVINTALGITAALKMGPIGIVLAVLMGVLGAVQIAAIASTPVPQFAEGTGEDGLPYDMVAEYGEAGRELVMVPDHKPFIAKESTTSFLPKGTQIIPNYETEAILAGQGGISEAKFDELIAETKDRNSQPQHITNVGRRGFEYFTREGNTTTKWNNKYLHR